jgi:hypothetical protein
MKLGLLSLVACTQAHFFINIVSDNGLPAKTCRREAHRMKKTLLQELINEPSGCPEGTIGAGDYCFSVACPSKLSYECGVLCTETRESCGETWAYMNKKINAALDELKRGQIGSALDALKKIYAEYAEIIGCSSNSFVSYEDVKSFAGVSEPNNDVCYILGKCPEQFISCSWIPSQINFLDICATSNDVCNDTQEFFKKSLDELETAIRERDVSTVLRTTADLIQQIQSIPQCSSQ